MGVNSFSFSKNTKFIVEPLDGFTGKSHVTLKDGAGDAANTIALNESNTLSQTATTNQYVIMTIVIPDTDNAAQRVNTYNAFADLTGFKDGRDFYSLEGDSLVKDPDTGAVTFTASGENLGYATAFHAEADGTSTHLDGCMVAKGKKVMYEIPLREGFSFSQAMSQQEITANEAVDGSGNTRRGRQIFNNSKDPAEFSFSTYIRPFRGVSPSDFTDPDDTSNHNNYFGRQPLTDSNHPTLVERVLWQMLGQTTVGAGVSDAYPGFHSHDNQRTSFGGLYGVQRELAFTYHNKGTIINQDDLQPKLANFYFQIDNSDAIQGDSDNNYNFNVTYKLSKACINEMTIDFDVDDILTAQWSGFASDITEVEDVSATIYEGTNASTNFIKTKMTKCRLGRRWNGVFTTQADGSATNSATVGHDLRAKWKTNSLVGGFAKFYNPSSNDGGAHLVITSNTETSITGSAGLVQTIDFETAQAGVAAGTSLLRVYNDDATLEDGPVDRIRRKVTPNMTLSVVSGGGSPTLNSAKTLDDIQDQVWSDRTSNNRLHFNALVANLDQGATIRLTGTETHMNTNDVYEINKDHYVNLVGGSITYSNNITYLTPSQLGKVDIPFAPILGTKTVSGNVSCYLTDDSANVLDSRSFYDAMIEDFQQDNPDRGTFGNVYIGLGEHPTTTTAIRNPNSGGDQASLTEVNAFSIDLPFVNYKMPTLSQEDSITFNVEFDAVPQNVAQNKNVTFKAFSTTHSTASTSSNIRGG